VYERWEKREVPTTAVATSIAADATPTPSTPDSTPAAPFRSSYHPAAVASAVIVAAIAIVGTGGWFLMSRSAEESTVAAPPAIVPLLQARPIAPTMSANFPALMSALVDENHGAADSPNASAPPLSVASAQLTASFALVPSVARTEPRAPSTPSIARTESPARSAPAPSVARTEPPSVSDPPIPQPTGQPPSATAALPTGPAEVGATSVSRTTDDVSRNNDGVAAAIDRAAPETSNNAVARSRSIAAPWPAPAATPLTYDAGHPDVTPPIPVLPRLLAGLQPSSPGVRLDALTIAVVVNGDGTAYSVTALNPPQNMGEFVLLTAALSVVKGWQFSPATRDGAPVRYRLIVPLRAVTTPAP
jgi:protein TonB